MPKHVPSFKHLIATSHSRQPEHRERERSVSEILNSSRASQAANAAREVPPHIGYEERIWTPGQVTTPIDDTGVHPAEVLRRSVIAQRQASRSVAGPAPPPSWYPPSAGKSALQPSLRPVTRRKISTKDIRRAKAIFPNPTISRNGYGTRGLVEYCLNAVLTYLNSDEVLPDVDTEDEAEAENGGGQGRAVGSGAVDGGCKLGDVMREQIGYLEIHLKAQLLDLASDLPEGDQRRLVDKSYKAILSRPDIEEDAEEEIDETLSRVSWDDIAPSTIHHLPLTLHHSPTSLLRQIPNLPALSLTSLNLAYSTISDLEKLVTVLPPSLRELSLCGVRLRGGEARLADVDLWRRGLGALGRRLMVLTMLDLSESPLPLAPHILVQLLHPANRRLPSLRILGLRDIPRTFDAESLDQASGVSKDIPQEAEPGPSSSSSSLSNPIAGHQIDSSELERRKSLLEVIRGGGRSRWVTVIWE